MAKNNPLFVDSTKFHGDRIGTQIELGQVLLYDGESLVVKIVDHQGEAHRLPMEWLNESTYVARVWLSHQKMITYQFVIEKEGCCLFSSHSKEVRAQYAIVEKWEPRLEYQLYHEAEFSLAVGRPEVAASLADKPWNADYATIVESLIEKWGL